MRFGLYVAFLEIGGGSLYNLYALKLACTRYFISKKKKKNVSLFYRFIHYHVALFLYSATRWQGAPTQTRGPRRETQKSHFDSRFEALSVS